MAPKMVPIRALETVMPTRVALRENTVVSCELAPAITAVSNPKSSPPSAATAVLLTNDEEMFIRCLVCHNGGARNRYGAGVSPTPGVFRIAGRPGNAGGLCRRFFSQSDTAFTIR